MFLLGFDFLKISKSAKFVSSKDKVYFRVLCDVSIICLVLHILLFLLFFFIYLHCIRVEIYIPINPQYIGCTTASSRL